MHALSTTHPMLKITRSAISRKLVNQKKKKKVHQIHIFIHLSAHFELKIQNTHRYRNGRSETGQPKKKKKSASNSHIYTPFCTF